ncbi:ferritin family protein [Candidatus Binatia bacterium]|nr:ferritin family protein [Candidatus Binatia bacterium]
MSGQDDRTRLAATPGIDFAHLTLRDALDLAVLIEAEAQERYEELAQQMATHDSPAPAAFFRAMAVNEAKHGAQLAERRRALFADAPRTVTRAMLWDVEAPDYDEARAFMSAHEAMRVALRAEKKAHVFFSTALPEIGDPGVEHLFTELCAEEVVHQDLVKAELAKLPPEREAGDDDFADEPNAQ